MDETKHNEDTPEVALDLDEQSDDLEAAMREAVAAVEEVERGRPTPRGRRTAGACRGGDVRAGGRQAAAGDRRPARPLDAHPGRLRQLPQARRARAPGAQASTPWSSRCATSWRSWTTSDLALSAAGLGRRPEARRRDDPPPDAGAAAPLRRHRRSPALGQPFDPTLHEAVSREEDPTVQAPTVTGELRRGYRLHDRLLRPSMVKVAVPAEAGQSGRRREAGPSLASVSSRGRAPS